MKTSARNQLQGQVIALSKGAVNAEVIVGLRGGDRLVAIITNESVDNLGLTLGSEVYALIKASWVVLAGEEGGTRTSARNRLCGVVERCREGAVNGEVVLRTDGGDSLVAIVTNESLRSLGMREGVRVCALIKASHVILAVND